MGKESSSSDDESDSDDDIKDIKKNVKTSAPLIDNSKKFKKGSG